MSHIHSIQIQASIRQWVNVAAWQRPFAVTLTLKQVRWNVDGGIVALTGDLASRNVRHFLNVLNKRVYGSAAQRHGKRLRSLATFEGSSGKRLHCHMMIDCPRPELVEHFPSMVASAWASTDWGDRQIDVQPCDQGWLTYMTKLRDKPDFAAAFDWDLCHNPN